MNKILREKIIKAFGSVLPITVVVLAASVVLTPIPSGTILMFLTGAAMLVLGMGFFTLGVDMAMTPLGEGIGVELTKRSKLPLIVFVTFITGFAISAAEPDLRELGRRMTSIPAFILVSAVALGVGTFLVIAVLRPLLRIRLSALLVVFYLIIFGVAYFVPEAFVPLAFDSAGAATSPVTIPFILAIGAGVVSIRSDRYSQDDSFGLVALCGMGTVLAMLLLGTFYRPGSHEAGTYALLDAATSMDVARHFSHELPRFVLNILLVMGVIVLCLVVFQISTRRYQRQQVGRIAVGFFYTLAGLVLFLTGVNAGFFPVGEFLGFQLASSPFRWSLIPIAALAGYFIVSAEPVVHVLTRQVEKISSGAITQKMMRRGLAVGMSAALTLTIIRIMFEIPVMWILIPGYVIALALTFFVPKLFVGIAFDSGIVCSGPMTFTFLLPFAMGACEGLEADLAANAFGAAATVAMTPLVVIQLMGLTYQERGKKATRKQTAGISTIAADRIIDWGKVTVFREGE